MDAVKFQYGCNVRPSDCAGPWENFYTIFGSRLENLAWHMIVALIIGFAFGSVLMKLKRKEKLNVPFIVILLLQAIVTIISFFVLAYTMPAGIYYP